MRNMRDSEEHHEEYQTKNIEIIKSKQSFLREEIDQLIYMNSRLKKPNIETHFLNEMNKKLKVLITKLSNEDSNKGHSLTTSVDRIKRDLEQANISFNNLNRSLEEINHFVQKSESTEHSIKVNDFVSICIFG